MVSDTNIPLRIPPNTQDPIEFILVITLRKLSLKSPFAESNYKITLQLGELTDIVVYPVNSNYYLQDPLAHSNTARLGVCCSLKQLSQYYNLHGPFKLSVFVGSALIGHVYISSLKELVSGRATDKSYSVFNNNSVRNQAMRMGSLNLCMEMLPVNGIGNPAALDDVSDYPDFEFDGHSAVSASFRYNEYFVSSRNEDVSIREHNGSFSDYMILEDPREAPKPKQLNHSVMEDPFKSPVKRNIPQLAPMLRSVGSAVSGADAGKAERRAVLDQLEEKALNLRMRMQDSLQKSKNFLSCLSTNVMPQNPVIQPAPVLMPDQDHESTLDLDSDGTGVDIDDLDSIIEQDDIINFLNSHADKDAVDTAAKLAEKSSPVLQTEQVIQKTAHALVLPKSALNALRNVYAFKLEFRDLEFSSRFQPPSIIWTEFTLPSSNDIHRFRTRVPVLRSTGKAATDSFHVRLVHEERVSLGIEEILESWGGSHIRFKIAGFGPQNAKSKVASVNSRSSNNSNSTKQLWKFEGRIKATKLLVPGNLGWSGDVYLSSSGDAINPAETEASVSVSLSFLLEEDQKTESVSPNRGEQASPMPKSVPTSPLVSSPNYLFMYLGKTRALAVPETTAPPLLFLRIRLFSSNNNPIETPPISYINPFDISTGTLGESTSFAFDYTVPLAFNERFIETAGKAPIIVEVYMISLHSDAGPGSTLDVKSRSTGSTPRETLLGLVRLPFNQLIDALVSTGGNSSVQIPDAAYVIRDPFSGESRGWITGFISIGTWEHVDELRRTYKKKDLNEFLPSPKAGGEEKPAPNAPSPDEKITPLSRQQVVKASTFGSSSSDSIISAESIVVLTIHRACGLRSLVSDYLLTADESLHGALEYAFETGVNAYCNVDSFPTLSGELGDRIVETQIVASSFTPEFESCSEITIRSVDTDLILWMKNGGCSQGQLWHRIPSHLSSTGAGQSCLLGTFSVPLEPLLTRSVGVYRRWLPIYFPSDPGNQKASIQVSVAFKHGYDLCQVKTHSLGPSTYQSLHLNLEMRNIQIYAPELSHASRKSIFVKWSHPGGGEEEDQSNSMFIWEYSDSCPVYPLNGNSCFYQSELVYYSDTDLRLSPDLLNLLQGKMLEFQIWLQSKDEELSKYLGSAFVDVSDLFLSTRGFQRSRTPSNKRPVLQGRYQLIDPESVDNSGSFVDIRIEMEFVKASTLFSSSRGTKPSTSPPIPATREISRPLARPADFLPKPVERETIPLKVKVHRAMCLPLVDDPLASSITSPFVRQNQTRTTPPNAFVTFSDFAPTIEDFQSHVVPAETSPSWDFEKTVHIAKTMEDLETVKSSGSLVIHVWHANEAHCIRKWKEELSSAEHSLVLEDKRDLMGTVKVPFDALFAGLSEINGWYPILDSYGCSKGQLLVQITPSGHLGHLLKALVIESKKKGERAGLCSNNVFHTAEEDTSLLAILNTSRAFSEPKAVTYKDTWVWNGSEWEHKAVPQNGSVNSNQPQQQFLPKQSISETMKELELLNSSMRRKLVGIEPSIASVVETSTPPLGSIRTELSNVALKGRSVSSVSGEAARQYYLALDNPDELVNHDAHNHIVSESSSIVQFKGLDSIENNAEWFRKLLVGQTVHLLTKVDTEVTKQEEPNDDQKAEENVSVDVSVASVKEKQHEQDGILPVNAPAVAEDLRDGSSSLSVNIALLPETSKSPPRSIEVKSDLLPSEIDLIARIQKALSISTPMERPKIHDEDKLEQLKAEIVEAIEPAEPAERVEDAESPDQSHELDIQKIQALIDQEKFDRQAEDLQHSQNDDEDGSEDDLENLALRQVQRQSPESLSKPPLMPPVIRPVASKWKALPESTTLTITSNPPRQLITLEQRISNISEATTDRITTLFKKLQEDN